MTLQRDDKPCWMDFAPEDIFAHPQHIHAVDDVQYTCLGLNTWNAAIVRASRRAIASVKETMIQPEDDPVNHPSHYNSDKVPGIECIDVVEHLSFNQGNAVKYIWRAEEKGDAIVDLRKARWYIDREIERLSKERS